MVNICAIELATCLGRRLAPYRPPFIGSYKLDTKGHISVTFEYKYKISHQISAFEILVCTCRSLATIGPDNSWSPCTATTNIATNAGLLIFICDKRIGSDWSAFESKSNNFQSRNVFEIVSCKMAIIVSRPQCVKSLVPRRCGCDIKLVISNSYRGEIS